MLVYEAESQIAEGFRAFSEPPAPMRLEPLGHCYSAVGFAFLFLARPFRTAIHFFRLSLVGVPSILSCGVACSGSKRCWPTPSAIGFRYRRLSRTDIAPGEARSRRL
jgi:hypothetical protein